MHRGQRANVLVVIPVLFVVFPPSCARTGDNPDLHEQLHPQAFKQVVLVSQTYLQSSAAATVGMM